jgi:hypothetical protein
MTTPYPKVKARKPVGGFLFLTAHQLCLVWWAYRSRLIQLRDLRVWFAAQEMVARRCQLDPGQVPEYTPKELHGLVGGGGGEHLRASIRRLETIGLLTWSTTTLTFATSPGDLRGAEDLSGFHTMHQAITNNSRRVPVPRQAVRLIAGGLKATVIATMLGHLLRCLYYREQRCISGGWCKASWIAEVFRVDLRSVKAARKHLVEMGWLQTFPTTQSLCNRWRTYSLINLAWTRTTLEQAAAAPAEPRPPAGTPATTQLPPLAAFATTQLPPLPKEDREPLQELEHQEPAPQAENIPTPQLPEHPVSAPHTPVSGVQTQAKAHPTPLARQVDVAIRPLAPQPPPPSDSPLGVQQPPKAPAPPPPPTLHHIVPDDLRETDRLLALFAQASTRGLIGKSESDRLTFLATAEHARVLGSHNPCGLFATLIRRQRWHYVTESDEDVASQRLKQHLYGQTPRRQLVPPPQAAAHPELSKDAFIVRELQREFQRMGLRGDWLA